MKKADSWQQENGRENTLFLKAIYHREKRKSKNLLNFLFFFQNIFPKILQKIYNKCRNGMIPFLIRKQSCFRSCGDTLYKNEKPH